MNTRAIFLSLFALTLPGTVPAFAADTKSGPTGFGSALPLEDAAKIIVPKGWNTRVIGNSTKQTPVSWSADDNWESTLTSIGKNNDLSVSINPASKTVTISEKAGGSTETTASAPDAVHPSGQTSSGKKEKTVRTKTGHRPRNEKYVVVGHAHRWVGGTRYDSPTINEVSPAQAAAMTAPIQGQPLKSYPIEGTAPQNSASQFAKQNDMPPFGDQYVPNRPVGQNGSYALAYPGAGGDSRQWTAENGESIDNIIRRWAKQSGNRWQVYSDPAHQPMYIRANIILTGPFLSVVQQLTENYHGNINPVISAHEASHVITITDTDHASPSTD